MKKLVAHHTLLLVLGFCLLPFLTVNAKDSELLASSEPVHEQPESEEALPTLTFEEGMERVLERNSRLKEASIQLERIEVLRDRASETLRYARPHGIGSGEEDHRRRSELLHYLQHESDRRSQRSFEGYLEELLAWELKTAFADLTLLKTQQDLIQQSLKYEEHMLFLAKYKLENGVISRGKLERIKRSKNQIIEEKNRLEQEINAHYLLLNQMMGFPADHRYLIEWDRDDENEWSFPEPAVQARRVRSRDPYLEQVDLDIEMGEWSLSLYTYNAGEEPYKAKELNIQSMRNKRSQIREQLEQVLTERIAAAEDLVLQSRQLQLKKEDLMDHLKELELLLDAGLVRNAEIIKAELDIKKTDLALQKNQHQLHHLAELIEHPYYVPDYLK